MEDRKRNLLTEHLKYEFDMLDAAYDFVHADKHSVDREDWFRRNSAIETFWLHARNLIEFFERKSTGTDTGVASAADFTDTSKTYDLPAHGRGIRLKIDEQICHLQYDRVTDEDHLGNEAPTKIGGVEMWQVKGLLDRAVEAFQLELTDEARQLWKEREPNRSLQFSAGAASHSASSSVSIFQSGHTGPRGPHQG